MFCNAPPYKHHKAPRLETRRAFVIMLPYRGLRCLIVVVILNLIALDFFSKIEGLS